MNGYYCSSNINELVILNLNLVGFFFIFFSVLNGHFSRCMLAHTELEVKDIIFVFQQCVLLSCLSPKFACYFLLSYDDERKRGFGFN